MIKKFIGYYKPHMKLFILDMVCAFLAAAADLFYPMISRKIINDVIPNRQLSLLYKLIIFLAALYILKLIFNYIVEYWGHVVGVRMQYDMRKEIFSHLQKLPFSYFDDNKTGHIMSRIVNDLMEVSELAHHGPEDLFISLVMLVGAFVALCTIDWRLTLIVFAFVPVMIIFSIKKRVKMTNAFKEVRKKVADVNAQLENSISGIRVAKSFTNEDYEMKKFNEGNDKFRISREFAYKAMAEFYSGIHFLIDVLNVIVICVGGIFTYKGIITSGDLVAYLLYISIFMQPIRRLTSFIEQYQSGMAGFERFMEIMNIQPDIKDREDAVELKDVKGDIEFRNVAFNYNDKKSVLSNINLKVEAGKTLALVGPSGGGKTTLCHLIPRFYEVTEGGIFIDGKNIKDLTLESLRKNIGIVHQDVFLFTGTIKENILYGNPDATDKEVIDAAKRANIHDFIINLPDGYDTYVGERGIKLSGGQKQRISIARVFLKNPPILILDEATSALDNATEIIIQKSLEKLSEGRTTIVVAHRLSTIKNADEIIVLTANGIEEKGSHEELIKKNGIYAKLYNSQFKGYIPDEVE
ncbi:ABC transporter ATP-binding protein [Clostridium thermopalmarium]|uniref:Putative multidrug export ATP-binding/permease protein n=1 Tax=Clostridium thermopalmarium DSM 5974 TaxID=1121340 RepID=A0A2T0AXT1_9CLOT|nr:ABC transporter ATP-binding protein [Clostridium thermopalmarium]PRR75707.1 putative multidrug export ATP-binding/permease protein [Clostridium thermopalmarium DSM 5974]PVZ26606.1 ATP-binding cassette subfamily B protein [Clostridium thermopalmarium DSM 5974]